MQDDNSLAHQVLIEQLENKWPGLGADAIAIANKLDVCGMLAKYVEMYTFKNHVKRLCDNANSDPINDDISKYKKLRKLHMEQTKGNSYFFNESLENARVLFCFRVEIYDAKYNFKNIKTYKDDNYLCDSCQWT